MQVFQESNLEAEDFASVNLPCRACEDMKQGLENSHQQRVDVFQMLGFYLTSCSRYLNLLHEHRDGSRNECVACSAKGPLSRNPTVSLAP